MMSKGTRLTDFVKDWLLPPRVTGLIRNMMVQREAEVSSLSTEDRALLAQTARLKDRHKGSRCFVLGAGSSVKRQDLKKLVGEIVLGVSNTFVHPDYHLFRPRYHILPSILKHTHVNPEEKFVEWLKEMEQKTHDAEMFFHIADRRMIESNGLFRNRTIHWNAYSPWHGDMATEVDLSRVPHVWSVSEFAITVAVYLGFDKIYLIGFDHDWYRGMGIYFYDKQTEHVIPLNREKLSNVDMEWQMRRHADIFRKYKYLYNLKKNIFNANADPQTYVDMFPKVDFESLFSGEE